MAPLLGVQGEGAGGRGGEKSVAATFFRGLGFRPTIQGGRGGEILQVKSQTPSRA